MKNKQTFFRLQNFYLMTEADQKLNTLVSFISKRKELKFIVFFVSCAWYGKQRERERKREREINLIISFFRFSVDYFAVIMKHLLPNVRSVGLHGQMDPKKRECKRKRNKVSERDRETERDRERQRERKKKSTTK